MRYIAKIIEINEKADKLADSLYKIVNVFAFAFFILFCIKTLESFSVL